jgi:hypothetical protein
METKEEVNTFTECKWCKQIVDREECFADLLTKDGKSIWICYCGELVPDQKQMEKNE